MYKDTLVDVFTRKFYEEDRISLLEMNTLGLYKIKRPKVIATEWSFGHVLSTCLISEPVLFCCFPVSGVFLGAKVESRNLNFLSRDSPSDI